MSITRAQVEAILVRRTGNFLAAAGLAVDVEVDFINDDLTDPLAFALRAFGVSQASAAAVVDADLRGIADTDLNQFLDIAELRTLETIATNLDLVDEADGVLSLKLGQLGDRLDRAITRKRAAIGATYGVGLGTLSGGVLTLDFATHGAA